MVEFYILAGVVVLAGSGSRRDGMILVDFSMRVEGDDGLLEF